MKIEHFAVNVSNPIEMAEWYVKNLGLQVVRKLEVKPFTHFLADDSGNVMIEIYNNPPEQVPEYSKMHPLLLHLAFVSEDPEKDKIKLQKVGAQFVEEVKPQDGSRLIMMRDPWGLSIQFCKRGTPMLKG